MDKGTRKYSLPIDHLLNNELVVGIITIDREAVESKIPQFVEWHHYLIVIQNTSMPLPRSPIRLIDEDNQHIIITCLSASELMEGDPMRNDDMRRVIAMGNIEWDRFGYIESLQQKLRSINSEREQLMLSKFTLFVYAYLNAKRMLHAGHELDALTSIAKALREWAELSAYEEGFVPDLHIWHQVKSLNPGVHKLYEELATSGETIHQRVELVLLACEFSITTKMKTCLAPLIRILKQAEKGLTLQEMEQFAELQVVAEHLPMLMDKLMRRGYVQSTLTRPEEAWVSIGLAPVYHWNEEREVVHG
ncbi:hypothetical protein MH117_20470 [Paenibacillus sp. ACRRX]|uniref:hypothetical protein n=1 Tax=Paenibacillus sp. ACRRX TaxID=2918206 RepID=UPI001EF513E9|nr:hypothetical protein [Paenibacillus sp. ACRRX]MCG7409785.1 hypothetical protein [Paenibacillus sp. ACRRX]